MDQFNVIVITAKYVSIKLSAFSEISGVLMDTGWVGAVV